MAVTPCLPSTALHAAEVPPAGSTTSPQSSTSATCWPIIICSARLKWLDAQVVVGAAAGAVLGTVLGLDLVDLERQRVVGADALAPVRAQVAPVHGGHVEDLLEQRVDVFALLGPAALRGHDLDVTVEG